MASTPSREHQPPMPRASGSGGSTDASRITPVMGPDGSSLPGARSSRTVHFDDEGGGSRTSAPGTALASPAMDGATVPALGVATMPLRPGPWPTTPAASAPAASNNSFVDGSPTFEHDRGHTGAAAGGESAHSTPPFGALHAHVATGRASPGSTGFRQLNVRTGRRGVPMLPQLQQHSIAAAAAAAGPGGCSLSPTTAGVATPLVDRASTQGTGFSRFSEVVVQRGGGGGFAGRSSEASPVFAGVPPDDQQFSSPPGAGGGSAAHGLMYHSGGASFGGGSGMPRTDSCTAELENVMSGALPGSAAAGFSHKSPPVAGCPQRHAPPMAFGANAMDSSSLALPPAASVSTRSVMRRSGRETVTPDRVGPTFEAVASARVDGGASSRMSNMFNSVTSPPAGGIVRVNTPSCAQLVDENGGIVDGDAPLPLPMAACDLPPRAHVTSSAGGASVSASTLHYPTPRTVAVVTVAEHHELQREVSRLRVLVLGQQRALADLTDRLEHYQHHGGMSPRTASDFTGRQLDLSHDDDHHRAESPCSPPMATTMTPAPFHLPPDSPGAQQQQHSSHHGLSRLQPGEADIGDAATAVDHVSPVPRANSLENTPHRAHRPAKLLTPRSIPADSPAPASSFGTAVTSFALDTGSGGGGGSSLTTWDSRVAQAFSSTFGSGAGVEQASSDAPVAIESRTPTRDEHAGRDVSIEPGTDASTTLDETMAAPMQQVFAAIMPSPRSSPKRHRRDHRFRQRQRLHRARADGLAVAASPPCLAAAQVIATWTRGAAAAARLIVLAATRPEFVVRPLSALAFEAAALGADGFAALETSLSS